MGLPEVFCWTKFGTEAGESVGSILSRKETERQSTGGVFLWGIGSSIAPSLRELLWITRSPLVIFSAMVARPKPIDVSPDSVVRWRGAVGLDGRSFEVPPECVVTSRAPVRPTLSRHFALVCRSDESLAAAQPNDSFDRSDVVNLRTGLPVGASQVTSVVRRISKCTKGAYEIGFTATLVDPYFVRLVDPVALSPSRPHDAGGLLHADSRQQVCPGQDAARASPGKTKESQSSAGSSRDDPGVVSSSERKTQPARVSR